MWCRDLDLPHEVPASPIQPARKRPLSPDREQYELPSKRPRLEEISELKSSEHCEKDDISFNGALKEPLESSVKLSSQPQVVTVGAANLARNSTQPLITPLKTSSSSSISSSPIYVPLSPLRRLLSSDGTSPQHLAPSNSPTSPRQHKFFIYSNSSPCSHQSTSTSSLAPSFSSVSQCSSEPARSPSPNRELLPGPSTGDFPELMSPQPQRDHPLSSPPSLIKQPLPLTTSQSPSLSPLQPPPTVTLGHLLSLTSNQPPASNASQPPPLVSRQPPLLFSLSQTSTLSTSAGVSNAQETRFPSGFSTPGSIYSRPAGFPTVDKIPFPRNPISLLPSSNPSPSPVAPPQRNPPLPRNRVHQPPPSLSVNEGVQFRIGPVSQLPNRELIGLFGGTDFDDCLF